MFSIHRKDEERDRLFIGDLSIVHACVSVC